MARGHGSGHRRRAIRPQRLAARRHRRHRHAHARQVRDGPGVPDGPRHDPGRGARSGLVHDPARPGAGESGRLVAPHVHRRQHGDSRLMGPAAQGGRHRARDARQRRRRGVGRRSCRLPGGTGRGDPHAHETPAPLRQARGACGAAPRPTGRPAQRPEAVPAARHPHDAARYPRQGRWQRRLRHRRDHAGAVGRIDRAVSRVRRHDQAVRRNEGKGTAGRTRGRRARAQPVDGEGRRLGRGLCGRSGRRRRHLLARVPGAQSARGRMERR